jgi:hypothetical protein
MSMPSETSSLLEIVVKFVEYVAADVLEKNIAEALIKHPNTENTLVKITLDFSDIPGIDIVASQQLTATVIAFRTKNWWPVIRIPKKKSVRDFWRAWSYPEAFKAATGMPFSSLAHPDDLIFFDEEQTTYPRRELKKIGNHNLAGTSREENFFCFFTENLSTITPTILADRETDLWMLDQVQDVLRLHLGDVSDYVPNRVVFEAMFNASKHPNAGILQSASFHRSMIEKGENITDDNSVIASKDRAFVMFFWDNGRSIIETLGSTIKDGVDIRKGYEGGYDRNYNLTSKSTQSIEAELERVINSAVLITKGATNDIILVQSLFPGVTSRPEGGIDDPHHFRAHLESVDPNLTKRGMGLYVLMNAVVDVLKGELSIRTDQYFLNVKKLGPKISKAKGAEMQITIRRMPDSLPKFAGNLIRVKVPSMLKAKAQSQVNAVPGPNSI